MGTKGEQTRSEVLRIGVEMTSRIGLEGLSIGGLAQEVGMSKSGLYAHFGSKEDLQCQVLDTAADKFAESVFVPAVREPRGRRRLEALFRHWLEWETAVLDGGCPFIGAASEFDDRPGPVRDRLIGHLERLLAAIAKAADLGRQVGDFRGDLDVEQFAYEVWAILVSYHHYRRLLDRPDSRRRAERAFATLLDASAARGA